jgi:hypothetical protein
MAGTKAVVYRARHEAMTATMRFLEVLILPNQAQNQGWTG